jgi:hypothetical protein
MRRQRHRRTARDVAIAIAAVAAWSIVVDVPLPAVAHAPETSRLEDLRSADAFKARFNEDRGHVRLVLLLSPT